MPSSGSFVTMYLAKLHFGNGYMEIGLLISSLHVTMYETRIHHYTPETKRSSAEWTAASESRPKRPKTEQWACKVMASVFWDAHGILFIDYLEKGKTINSEYLMALLDRLIQ